MEWIKTGSLVLLLSMSFSFCKEKDWRDELEEKEEEYLKEVRKTQEFLIQNRKDEYTIPNSQPSLKKSITQFLKDATRYEDPNKIPSLMNETELKEIFYPYVLGTGTALDSNPFPRYEEMIRERRKMALVRIQESLKKYPWDDIDVQVSELRTYGPILGHKIDKVTLIRNQNQTKLENIKMVIEHKGQFKVAVIAP